MTHTIAKIAFLLGIATLLSAWFPHGKGSGGGGCTNSLNFSQSCNSGQLIHGLRF
jgi:hypothetical protein